MVQGSRLKTRIASRGRSRYERAPEGRVGRRGFAAAVVALAGLLVFIPAAAELSGEQEARYRTLLEELRCLVCQNQTLAESSAELAGDLRQRVLEMVKDGHSNEAILAFMTARYGDFIRYRPPVEPRTWLLWAAPLLLPLILLAALFRYVSTRSRDRGAPG